MQHVLAGPPGHQPRPISLFIARLGLGGAERVAIALAGGLVAAGWPVELVLGRATGELLGDVPPAVPIVELKTDRTLPAACAFTGYLRRRKPRAVISHMRMANIAALLARRASGHRCRVAAVEHGIHSQSVAAGRIAPVRRLLIRRTYRWADAVVGVSQGCARDLEQALGLSNVSAIYNPVVDAALRRRAQIDPRHAWFREGVPVLLAVGRLSEVKDFPTLLRAVARVRRRRPVRLIVLGEGPSRPQLEALCRQLDLDGDVQLLGNVANPLAYMSRARMLALSSRSEALPTVLIEALACGCPVVAADCPAGPREILDGGRYGRLVPVGDDQAFAQAIEATLDAPPSAAPLRARAELFSVERAVAQYLRLLGLETTSASDAQREAPTSVELARPRRCRAA